MALTGFLVIALLALGAWFTIDEGAEPDPLSRAEGSAITGRLLDAVNTGDESASRAVYATDVLYEDLITPTTQRGIDGVVAEISSLHVQGFVVERSSAVITSGDTATFAMTFGDELDRSPGLTLIEVEDGKVVRQVVWGIGGMEVTE